MAVEAKVRALTDAPAGFGPLNRDLTRLMIALDQSDSPPANQVIEAFRGMCEQVRDAVAKWEELRTTDVPPWNAVLHRESLPPVGVPPACGN